MALRLGEHLIYGELRNTDNYATTGIVALRGETPDENLVLYLQLTGNCDPDLRGKHFRVQPDSKAPDPTTLSSDLRQALEMQQVGPTGEVTAQGWTRLMPCSPAEFYQRAKLGEPPPTRWARRFYLEWYSQNGRVVIDVAGATVEECVREPRPEREDDDGDWVTVPNVAKPGTSSGGEGDSFKDEAGWISDIEALAARDDDDDGFSLGALQQTLDAEANAVDRSLCDEGKFSIEDGPPLFQVWEAPEDGGSPFDEALPGLDKLPPAADLDDEEVELLLKDLLARMALISVALDVCPHFTPRDAYSLLRDTIFREESILAQKLGEGYVQHFMTHEFCSACEAEMEEMEEREQHGDSDSG